VERLSADNWVSACREIEVEGSRGHGRDRKTWNECVKEDMRRLQLQKKWRRIAQLGGEPFLGNRLIHASAETQT